MKSFARSLFAFATLILAFATVSFSQVSKTAEAFPNIKIKNFGQMDANYYRGGQPKQDQYQSLKDLGVTTVIDLRNDPESYEKPTAESLGMKYINIPMDDAVYPSEASIATFLKEINDPANGVMYVHCKGGKHRAGVTGAVYRFNKYGWSYDQAFAEMERFNFDTSWGRKVMKTFVQDYSKKFDAAKQQQATAAHGR
ncbi:MAG TPA: tyrosine-protein phosphatase [Pyrinomonadaceae bacterium]|nr:tyrosine-protein phosphatase [Pyrinomonadaceae bacterium]